MVVVRSPIHLGERSWHPKMCHVKPCSAQPLFFQELGAPEQAVLTLDYSHGNLTFPLVAEESFRDINDSKIRTV